jgi:hypothetical protein
VKLVKLKRLDLKACTIEEKAGGNGYQYLLLKCPEFGFCPGLER